MSIEREKQVAAEAAAELVQSGMTVGLGTGSTVAYLLPALAKRSLDILCAATSPRTEHAARELGLRIEDVTSIDRFDITIDGADQIAPDGWLDFTAGSWGGQGETWLRGGWRTSRPRGRGPAGRQGPAASAATPVLAWPGCTRWASFPRAVYSPAAPGGPR